MMNLKGLKRTELAVMLEQIVLDQQTSLRALPRQESDFKIWSRRTCMKFANTVPTKRQGDE
jgi:hypothetical protein